MRTAVRTGDTTARERREAARRPPHVLVTTPESLFILLTSESGRRALSDVRTVIVDEIHAVAADKRGAHLALSLERLEALVSAGQRSQRGRSVGDGAAARGRGAAAGRAAAAAARGRRRRPAARPGSGGRGARGRARRGRAPTSSGASSTTAIATLAREHRSTLVFVNTRRLVERVTLHLGERLGADAVAAHHGSLSRERRHRAERR